MRLCYWMFAVTLLSGAALAQSSTASFKNDGVYEKNCAKCHGKTGEGRHFGGPSLLKSTLSEDELKAIIANGKGHMPKFAGKLTPDQISALAGEIKAMNANPPAK